MISGIFQCIKETSINISKYEMESSMTATKGEMAFVAFPVNSREISRVLFF